MEKNKKISLLVCLVLILQAVAVLALEYRLSVGDQHKFRIRYGEPSAELQCLLTVNCVKLLGADGSRTPSDGSVSNRVAYSMVFMFSDFSMNATERPEIAKVYEPVLDALTSYSYRAVMDKTGAIIDSDFADAVQSIDIEKEELRSFVANNVIRPLAAGVWLNLFPMFSAVDGGRVFFGDQKWTKLGMPEFEVLTSGRKGGYRIRRIRSQENHVQGFIIWQDHSEWQAKQGLGYGADIQVDAESMLLFDETKGIFVHVSDVRKTTMRSESAKESSVIEAFFHCEIEK